MGLVEPHELATYLQRAVQEVTADTAVRVAEGWLWPVTGAVRTADDEWPAPVPRDLWAWAIELAAIAYDNPTGQLMRTVGAQIDQWTVSRRSEILAEAAARYGSAVAAPAGSFPPAPTAVGW